MDLSVCRSAGPLIDACEKEDIRLVINFATGMGHIASESDNFMRMKHLGHIDPQRRYAFIEIANPAHEGFAECFDFFDFTIFDIEAFWAMREVALFRPDLTVDIGVSDWKLAPPRGKNYFALGDSRLVCKATWQDTVDAMRDYWARDGMSPDYRPWRRPLPLGEDLVRALDYRGEALALIHLKPKTVNATAGSTPPETYLPALAELRQRGFKLVFVGREPMPALFQPLGIVNYAESSVATVANDIRLFANAGFALITGSGIGNFADVLHVPMVYLNFWHAFFPRRSPFCVELPAISRDPTTGRLSTLSEQAALFAMRGPFETWDYPSDRGAPRLACADEILAAVREALSLDKATPRSALQQEVACADMFGFMRYARSRIGQYFLERNPEVIG